MIRTYPKTELGHANLGWLDSRFHFSFADYYNPERLGFGALRVINDDLIEPGTGFGTHPHRDMEIITFVRRGAISHRDSMGNAGRTEAGDVQVMSAGTGILHSEHNRDDETTSMFQIWIHPKVRGVKPRWESATFSNRQATDSLPLLVSGRAEDADKGALFIHQDASISGGQLTQGQSLSQPIHDQAYLVVSKGEVEVEGVVLREGDGAEITKADAVQLKALSDAEVILIDVPA
jgi:redox-sensitive bicupin YhaK (pirin superfamily)